MLEMKVFRESPEKIFEDLKKQDIKDSAIYLIKNAFLHYQGSHQNIEIKFDTIEKMRQSFENEHKKRFGFFVEGRTVFIEMLTVEAVGNTSENQDVSSLSGALEDAKPLAHKKMFVNKSEIHVPIFLRSELKVKQNILGPAIIYVKQLEQML